MIQSVNFAHFGQGWETESPTSFGEWLSQSRRVLRLTRDELSRRVGCSVSALRKFEDDQRRPSRQIAELLANGLGVAPDLRPTFVGVARGELGVSRLPHPALTAPSATPATTSRPRLPVAATPMIGRERELAELGRVLRDPQCRLLALVGPGGIGKTRLGIEVASQLQSLFSDGASFIPLASISSARFIVPVIAEAIGFSFQGNLAMEPKEQLLEYLREKEALLLLDNLEHLLSDAGIQVLTNLLEAAPRVKLLVTSRESPGLAGQWLYDVQGLPVPQSGASEDEAQNTSVELFLQRARRAQVSFDPAPGDYAAIVRICQLVEGTPLAIELAAAWVRTLSPGEIAKEIERGLDFLQVATGEFPARHRSLRAVFEQSWKLLPNEERRVLMQLSMFRGGFRREAAEQVAGAGLPLLNTLVAKSLVRRSEAGRYDLHELVRQFAAEQSAEGEEAQSATRAQHARYYLQLFARSDARLRSAAQQQALTDLTAEMDNFRLAWDWAIAHGEFALIELSLRAFAMLYDTRGWYQEGINDLGRAVDALETAHRKSPRDRANQIALGHLLTALSLFTYRLAQLQQAQSMLERALEILRPVGDPGNVVEPLAFLGTVMILTGKYGKADELCTEGREKAVAVGDQWFAAMCLSLQGTAAMHMGQYELAQARLGNAVAEWRDIGDPRFTAFGLNSLGQIALTTGRYDAAYAALEESVALNISVGARWNLGHAYQWLGAVAQAQGQHQQAVDMFRKAVDALTELGGRFYAAQGLAQMGQSMLALGKETEAENVWREAMRIAMEIHGTPVALDALVGVAILRARKGDFERALEILSVVLNHPSSSHDTLNRATNLRTEVEGRLTAGQVQSAMTRVASKTLEEVALDVLQDRLPG